MLQDAIILLFRVFGICLLVYLYLSTPTYLYSLVKLRKFDDKPFLSFFKELPMQFGAFIGSATVVYFGLLKAFFFIPGNVGAYSSEDGSFTSYREVLAVNLAIIVVGVIGACLAWYKERRIRDLLELCSICGQRRSLSGKCPHCD